MASKRIQIDLKVNVKKGTTEFKKFRNSAKSDLKTVEKQAKVSSTGMIKSFKAVGAAVGVAFAVSAIKNLISETIDLGDKLGKLSSRLGTNVAELDKLRQVAELNGVAFNTLTMGLQRMTRRVSQAADGSGEAKDALIALGISAKDLNRLAPEEQFRVIAEKLSKVTNQADKVRLAFKLFDSEGVSLIQTMDGLDEQLSKVNSNWTPEKVKAAEAFNDTITRMKEEFTKLATDVIPPLLKVLKPFADLVEAITGMFDEESKAILDNRLEWSRLQGELDDAIARRRYAGKAYNDQLNESITKSKDLSEVQSKASALQISNLQDQQAEQRLLWSDMDGSGFRLTLIKGTRKGQDGVKTGPLPLPETTVWTDEKMNALMKVEADIEKQIALLDKAYNKLRDIEPPKTAEQLADEKKKTEELEKQAAALKEAALWAKANYVYRRADHKLGVPRTKIIEPLSFEPPEGIAITTPLSFLPPSAGPDIEELTLAQNLMGAAVEKLREWKVEAANLEMFVTDIMESTAQIFASGLADGIMEFADGTKSAEDAFKDFAGSFLRQIGRMIIQMTILKAIQAGFGGIGAAEGAVYPGGFEEFARGGVVNKPTLGVIGEGRKAEAVVPLDNGMKIPVNFRGGIPSGGGGGGDLNVTNNIVVEGGGSSGDNKRDEMLAKTMARVIEVRIKQIIMNEKRQGGMLYRGTY